MRRVVFFITLFFLTGKALSQPANISVSNNQGNFKLVVNGKDFFINGMNWDYYPIGTNFAYSLWKQPDDIIKAALDVEMPLLHNMGINAIRVYTGIQPKWIKYIFENYGVYTMLNHTFGRYGLTIDGAWEPNTDYANPKVRALLLKEVKEMVDAYKGTPGLLLFLLGNENNYGLFWRGAETENIPVEQRKSTIGAKSLYKLFNDAAVEAKSIDQSHPIAICNGDLLFLDIINKECTNVDILGINAYRGMSFSDLFTRVKNEYGKPMMFTEFGSDAYNTKANSEDQEDQAKYLVSNWSEIYGNAASLGKAGNCIGGFTFQFSDGWWKSKQTADLDIHDVDAGWANGGYQFDFVPGENNMNEEWWGICAKGQTDERGLYKLYPRAAYYALKEAHKFNPYAAGNNAQTLAQYFAGIQVTDAVLKARGDKAAAEGETTSKISLGNVRAEFSTFNTGGSLITTPSAADPNNTTTFPNRLGFDHMESVYVGVNANPAPNVRANVQFNLLGHVAENPIDEIFYENRGRPVTVVSSNGTTQLASENRVQLYRASINWNQKYFDLTGFYRTGHYHWGYEGDFFGLYPEANYGPNIDIYNGEAPVGFEMAGKKFLDGLKVAFGPQLYWGANPAVLVKYSKKLAGFTVTGIYHEDIDKQTSVVSSIAIPQPQTRRVTIDINRKFGRFGFDIGAIWAGQPLNGRLFQLVSGVKGNYTMYQDQIKGKDNWGGKIKLTYTGRKFNWYAQSAAMGLVANGGADYTKTFTGWSLKDCGSGNQYNVISGFTYLVGNLQIAPNFLWQTPIEGPIPAGVPAPGRPRNILDDPFVVRSNREMTAGEILFTYDPTPATWMYDWDNDRSEDAKLAISAGVVYRHLPTTQDAGIGFQANGRTTYAFNGAPPAADLWEAKARIVSKLTSKFGWILGAYGGQGQANGSDPRLIKRYGADLRMIYKKVKLVSAIKFNDWGPYDYHRDFNETYPLQFMADLSTEVSNPDWFALPGTRIGVRWTYRTLDKYSNRYNPTQTVDANGNFIPDPNAIGFPNGNEWEFRTYIQINIGK